MARRAALEPDRRAQASKALRFAAPTAGWITNQNIAQGNPLAALVLENYFPTQKGIRVRRGSSQVATIGSDDVKTLFIYEQPGIGKLFAADETSIYDVTSPADPEIAPTAEVTGQTSGYYSTAHFANSGGYYLYAVNGTDEALLYDGTTWTPINSGSTIAITGVSTEDLSHVWVYRGRIFFIERDSLVAWALPVDSLGGAAIDISLAGIFQRGGSLLLGGTWSLDAGDGIDDKCVFITDQGEAAIYEGFDPSDAANWTLVGRYSLGGKPLGKNATFSAGGDFLIATQDGIVPISAAVQKDPAALSLQSVSQAIEPDWLEEAQNRNISPWNMVKWTSENMAIIGLPSSSTDDMYCFVVNLETGAWAKYTGWDTRCLAVLSDNAYFGTSDGRIMQCEIGGSDGGDTYYCHFCGAFNDFGAPGVFKHIDMARAVFVSSTDCIPKLGVSTNYVPTFQNEPLVTPDDPSVGVWGVGTWGSGTWGSSSAVSKTTRWVGIGRSGFAIAPTMQISVGGIAAPGCELASIDILYRDGGIVT